jgi:hypothetical protein
LKKREKGDKRKIVIMIRVKYKNFEKGRREDKKYYLIVEHRN